LKSVGRKGSAWEFNIGRGPLLGPGWIAFGLSVALSVPERCPEGTGWSKAGPLVAV